MIFYNNRFLKIAGIVISLAACVFVLKTISDIEPIPSKLIPDASDISRMRVLDRNNLPLNITYQNQWNTHDYIPLYEMPEFCSRHLGIIISEDKRFYSSIADFLNAVWQNLRAMGSVRGASTISEQVVKMLHARKRTVWARWLEGFEAQRLEKRFRKRKSWSFILMKSPMLQTEEVLFRQLDSI